LIFFIIFDPFNRLNRLHVPDLLRRLLDPVVELPIRTPGPDLLLVRT
jgi:hypothetical protein